jgi:hypothetical protein
MRSGRRNSLPATCGSSSANVKSQIASTRSIRAWLDGGTLGRPRESTSGLSLVDSVRYYTNPLVRLVELHRGVSEMAIGLGSQPLFPPHTAKAG